MPDNNIVHFIYENLNDEKKKFSISINKVFEHHFAGKDIERNKYLTFRKDRVVEYKDNTEKLLATYPVEPFKTSGGGNKTFGVNTNNPNKLLEVCFTGFKKADKFLMQQVDQKQQLKIQLKCMCLVLLWPVSWSCR